MITLFVFVSSIIAAIIALDIVMEQLAEWQANLGTKKTK